MQSSVSHRALESLTNLMGVSGFEFDVESGRFSWLSGTFNVFERDEQAETGHAGLAEYLSPSDFVRATAQLRRAIETGEPTEGYFDAVTAAGNQIRIHIIHKAEKENGRTVRVLGAIQDVGNDERAREALLRQKLEANSVAARFQALLQASEDVVYEMSADWSTARHLISGNFVEDTLEPTSDWRKTFIPEDDLPRVLEAMQDAIRTRSPYELEHRIWRADGSLGWTHSRAVPILTEDGEIETWFGMASDITDRKELELKLKDALGAANAASEAKSAFVANMSHELRTPMSSIIGMLEILLATPLDQEQREHAQTAAKSARDLLHVLNDVLDTSSIEAGRVSIESQPFNMRDLLADELALFGLRAEQKGLSLEAGVASDFPDWLLADERRIRQIMNNLIGNALKFTNAGNVSVIASFDSDENVMRVEVTDTGIGISDAVQDLVFQPFTQADSTLSRKYEGSGLGLTISRKLVELMRGRIGISSQPGVGSTFWFEIPALSCAPPEQACRPTTQAVCPPMRILVAEDNPTARKIIHAMLSAMGHRATLVEDGAAAVAAVASGNFDVILMDVMMPGMDGPTATRKIRELGGRAGGLPIIALTADIMFGKGDRHVLAGMTDCVSKPVDATLLATALQRAYASAIEHAA